jgi:hypothetical protein
MTERMIKDFAERAEARVRLPDLAQLESRGRDLRRTRMTVGGAVAALLLMVSGVVATVAHDLRTAPPTENPKPEIEELDSRPFDYHQQLVPGVDYTFSPWTLGAPTVTARLTVPDGGWAWWGDGLTKPRHGYAGLFPTPRRPYATVGVMQPDRVSTTSCRSFHMTKKPEFADLAAEPVAAAQQIGGVPGVEVEEAARRDNRFGHPGAHIRISVPRLCPETKDLLLWSVEPAEYAGAPGTGSVRYAGQLVDVWIVDVEGAQVLVYRELSPGLPASFGAESSAVLDSIRLERLGR